MNETIIVQVSRKVYVRKVSSSHTEWYRNKGPIIVINAQLKPLYLLTFFLSIIIMIFFIADPL